MLNRQSVMAIAVYAPTRFLGAEPRTFHALPAALGQLEHINRGRLGVAVLDTGTGERSGHRAKECFPMCSTFKFLLASAVLQRVDQNCCRITRISGISE
jgi:beta-lactamase class A